VPSSPPYKIPESVLVVIHTPALEVLLIERAESPGFWQSVTGSKDAWDEPFDVTAAREVAEETGLDVSALRPVRARGAACGSEPAGTPGAGLVAPAGGGGPVLLVLQCGGHLAAAAHF